MAKILYVDDDLQLSGMIEDWLTYEKHSVEVVHTGHDGWERLKSNQYDVVILDWDLPDLNGIDILKRFRSGESKTPVLMLTGHTAVDDKEKGLDAGADDYLTKPFHTKELSARIRSLIRRSETQVPVFQPLGTGNEEVLNRANLAGTSLASRYEFVDVLGEGGLGIVFKAIHPELEKAFAVKMLLSEQMTEEIVERFKREAKAISRLDHLNIITVTDFGATERGQPYMVMELIQGQVLSDLIADEGALPTDQALDICVQTAHGIGHAHEVGILHRDIKPSNIMLKPYAGRSIVKILDFGFAKFQTPESKKPIELTQKGLIFGSPPYMSPEQVRGVVLDERSDIYSFGCVLYETLTGCPPHFGENSVDVMLKHLNEPVLSLKELRPDLDLPLELEPIVAKALQRNPDDRFQSMQEVIHDLEPIRSRLKIPADG